jgi:hypothetical protein
MWKRGDIQKGAGMMKNIIRVNTGVLAAFCCLGLAENVMATDFDGITATNIAQVAPGTTNYFLGKLGIGTNNPATPLHVVGNARIDGTLRVFQGSSPAGNMGIEGLSAGPTSGVTNGLWIGGGAGVGAAGSSWLALGFNTGNSCIGSYWSAVGYYAAYRSPGASNLFLGSYAYWGDTNIVCTNVTMLGAHTYYIWTAATNKLGRKDNILILGSSQSAYLSGSLYVAGDGLIEGNFTVKSNLVVGTGTATAPGSVAEGCSTASGWYSHAEGTSTASSSCSHAEGGGTTASGGGENHSEGISSVASGYCCSHAEGENTYAEGEASHSEGYDTEASGLASHSAGEHASAYHNNAYVWSDGTTVASTTNKQYTVCATNGIRLMGGPTTVVPGGDISMGTFQSMP